MFFFASCAPPHRAAAVVSVLMGVQFRLTLKCHAPTFRQPASQPVSAQDNSQYRAGVRRRLFCAW